MIQELLGMVEERKISIPGGLLVTDHGSSSSSSSSFSSPSSATSSPSPMSSSSPSSEPQQNLRCPRCDSPNTKFCYYNNYNLTQPRHFCKTCRRYWTKGGALRNVPIGGGCRKAKPSPAVTAAGRVAGAKIKCPSPGGLDQDLPSSPILWASPYSPQLLALLRANQLQLQNPNPNPTPTKLVAEPAGEQSLNLDPLRQLAVGQSNSLWMGGGGQYQYPYHQHHQQLQQQHQQQHNVLMGEMQSSGIQELLQRLRSSANYHNNHSPAAMSNVSSGVSFSTSAITTANVATNTGASILEPLPLSGGDFGYWNPAFSWADLPTTNGAFP